MLILKIRLETELDLIFLSWKVYTISGFLLVDDDFLGRPISLTINPI